MENSSFNFEVLKDKVSSWFSQAMGGANAANIKIVSLGVKRDTYIKALIALGVSAFLALGLIGYALYQNTQLNNRLSHLNQLENYDLQSFRLDPLVVNDATELRTIDQMVDYYDDTLDVKNKIQAELDFKRSVYSDFLRNLLLPSLNIWKNPYTQHVDLTLLGKKYLDQNPYQDVALLEQRGNIIRESGQNIGVNDVVNMQIGDIKEEANGTFYIPISIDFKSDSKRAFLLLVDKLSQTSNINNIGLFNDFSFHLFEMIRELKAEQLKELAVNYGRAELGSGEDQRIAANQIIAQHLYDFIRTGDQVSSPLLDNQLIDSVIKHSVGCVNSESQESCYFRFRDKYRSLPSLAYTIGQRTGIDKVLLLKDFYKNIPPLIAIESFTFDKAEDTGMTLVEQGAYVGSVSFKIYGRGISSEDSAQITQLLSNECYGSGANQELSLSSALEKINDQLSLVSNAADVSDGRVSRIANLIELKEDLEEDAQTFDGLTPFAQLVKKFEMLRAMKNLSLCQW